MIGICFSTIYPRQNQMPHHMEQHQRVDIEGVIVRTNSSFHVYLAAKIGRKTQKTKKKKKNVFSYFQATSSLGRVMTFRRSYQIRLEPWICFWV